MLSSHIASSTLTRATKRGPEASDSEQPKRRSRKGLKRQFICDQADCGKMFTRLEHLSRHQLNHKPKQIFKCTWTGCDKTFVREDLQLRHLERHEKRRSTTGGVIPKRAPRVDHIGGQSPVQETDSDQKPDIFNLVSQQYSDMFLQPSPKVEESFVISKETGFGFYPQNTHITTGANHHTPVSDLRNTANPRELTATPGSDSSRGIGAITTATSDTSTDARFSMPSSRQVDLRTTQISDLLSASSPTSVIQATVSPDVKTRSLSSVTFSEQSPSVGLQNGVVSTEEPDLIQWLFSDAVMSNIKDPLLSPSFFESPIDIQTLFSPPTAAEDGHLSEETFSRLYAFLPIDPVNEGSQPQLQQYINKYWEYFHPQYPLLHRPSFDPNNCPLGLLWTIVQIGAAYDHANNFANRICEHLRFAIFQSKDFTPPSSLWVFQALLITEIYEKSISTRKFHERGHIHHAATIQLIRRGSALFDDNEAPGHDPWQKWVHAESLKRAALTCFILDVFDAALFGHPLMMSVHEIRLSLPCSESLWAEYPSEKSTIPSGLNQTFLGELKKTLNRKHVDTGPFGRRALLAGLICISLQMQQKDLQVSSVGWGAFKNTWRDILTPAFDFWKRDHDLSLKKSSDKQLKTTETSPQSAALLDKLPTNLNSYSFLLRTQGCTSPFYHLSHILMFTSILDFQTYAGCPATFNHPIRKTEYDEKARKIKGFVQSVCGKQALWHAVRFLREMFLASPKELLSRRNNVQTPAYEYSSCSCSYPISKSVVPSVAGSPAANGDGSNGFRKPSRSKRRDSIRFMGQEESCDDDELEDEIEGFAEMPGVSDAFEDMVRIDYDGANDPISKRPHILYVCAVVVWAYGFCDDGSEQDVVGNRVPRFPPNANPDEVAQAWDDLITDIPSKEDGYEYLYRLSSYTASQLDKVPGKQNTVGLLRLVRASLRNQTWELVGEGRRLINHIILRSLGSKEVVCDYMFNPRVR